MLIRQLWQLKTVVFLYGCLLRAALLGFNEADTLKTNSNPIYYNTEQNIYIKNDSLLLDMIKRGIKRADF